MRQLKFIHGLHRFFDRSQSGAKYRTLPSTIFLIDSSAALGMTPLYAQRPEKTQAGQNFSFFVECPGLGLSG